MTYTEAVQHKKESLENADESVMKNYHLIIAPSNIEESQRCIETFLSNPKSFNDKSCKKFCTNDDYQVISFRKDVD
ncbi:hypothetical protein [Chryseobacterium sp. ERMR1:04]|uniref:hypothetical protein n=1 Tax=Chryseobacterium sp. ERMR1:04 TaxID=1705393 RepID=UPI0006C8C112|nr:hypothetical protein [Chryseobacterium sp. ERMR1:04]KPH14731.1 hypothetical protein AMQ68_04590 [Chryseobacterium sp. ERMR1:04]